MVELEDIPDIHRAPLRQLGTGQRAQILRVDNEFATTVSIPAIRLSRVVFPDPDGPSARGTHLLRPQGSGCPVGVVIWPLLKDLVRL